MMSPRTSRVWFWALTAAALLYTALLSWWSPLTSDTYHHALTGMEHCFSFSLVWERCVASYMTWNPRIGEYLAFAVATAGKWLFMLLNPFVQVGLALMMFYLASGRRVDPRSWPDVRLFGLGLLLLFTCTARPGVTIYWLSGATNYSWGASVWLGFLCLYRGLLDDAESGRKGDSGRNSGWGKFAAAAVLGFPAGMTNETIFREPGFCWEPCLFLSAWCGRKNFPCGFMRALCSRWQVPCACCLRPAFPRGCIPPLPAARNPFPVFGADGKLSLCSCSGCMNTWLFRCCWAWRLPGFSGKVFARTGTISGHGKFPLE